MRNAEQQKRRCVNVDQKVAGDHSSRNTLLRFFTQHATRITQNLRTNFVSNDLPLLERIQQVLDDYRPTLYRDGGDVEVLRVDEKGVAHVKMLGACIDCPISLLTMRLGIQRLLKENFSEITGVNAITDLDISALYRK
jgi:Fe-S cluster biogenesis protein NfuA